MNTTVSRRDFLKIVFGTASAAALTHPLSLLWPEEAAARPLADPYILGLDDSGYLIDPAYDWRTEYPPVREEVGYDTCTLRGKLSVFEEQLGLDEMMKYTNKPLSQWNRNDLAEVERDYNEWLDEPREPETLSFREGALRSPYWPGIEIYEQLWQEIAALGLVYVEGDAPFGSSFCGVRYDGDLIDLNNALAKGGLNMVVRY